MLRTGINRRGRGESRANSGRQAEQTCLGIYARPNEPTTPLYLGLESCLPRVYRRFLEHSQRHRLYAGTVITSRPCRAIDAGLKGTNLIHNPMLL